MATMTARSRDAMMFRDVVVDKGHRFKAPDRRPTPQPAYFGAPTLPAVGSQTTQPIKPSLIKPPQNLPRRLVDDGGHVAFVDDSDSLWNTQRT